ncbi:MAG: hypothetical protein ACE14S_09630 [Candidatus Bathyarchaeia archaeon]
MTAERAIHAAVFALLLIGLWIVIGWASYQYVTDVILMIASIALGWGIILLVLYLIFRRLNWHWWSTA